MKSQSADTHILVDTVVQRFILGRDPEGITMHAQNKQFSGQTIRY